MQMPRGPAFFHRLPGEHRRRQQRSPVRRTRFSPTRSITRPHRRRAFVARPRGFAIRTPISGSCRGRWPSPMRRTKLIVHRRRIQHGRRHGRAAAGNARSVRTLRCLASDRRRPRLRRDGSQGRGSPAHFGLHSPRIVYVGTLGKAAGVAGASSRRGGSSGVRAARAADLHLHYGPRRRCLAAAVETSLDSSGKTNASRTACENLIVVLREGLRERERRLRLRIRRFNARPGGTARQVRAERCAA